MQKTAVLATVFALGIPLAGCAPKSTPDPLMGTTAMTTSRVGPGTLSESSVISSAATVTAIDHRNRQVTLRFPDGRTHTVQVDPAVRNLEQVRRGDEVIATYYESVAVHVRRAGTAEPGVTTDAAVARAEPGQRPAGAMAATTTVTATVVAVDRKHHTIDLRGPEGNVRTVDVQHPEQLAHVKVGDLVELRVTQALAIQVEKAPRRR
jgi:hypothetical protein